MGLAPCPGPGTGGSGHRKSSCRAPEHVPPHLAPISPREMNVRRTTTRGTPLLVSQSAMALPVKLMADMAR